MRIITNRLRIQSRGENHIIDLTKGIEDAIRKSGARHGFITIFAEGSTAAITTIEYEPGLLKDFPEMLERLVPKNIPYEHQKRWRDDNGHSHLRASLIGPSLTIPFIDEKLTLGIWQQVVFVELDTRPRSRSLILQILGE
jgi:secondary thiamine-phosphate synthase enzyme